MTIAMAQTGPCSEASGANVGNHHALAGLHAQLLGHFRREICHLEAEFLVARRALFARRSGAVAGKAVVDRLLTGHYFQRKPLAFSHHGQTDLAVDRRLLDRLLQLLRVADRLSAELDDDVACL